MYRIVNGVDIKMTQEEIDLFEAESLSIAAVKEKTKWLVDRLREYPPTSELVVAMWESEVEGKTESIEALQIKREAIKAKYPKPIEG